MESRAKLLGHPFHPMLIVFPLGLLGTAVLFDIAYFLYGNVSLASASFWMITAGLIGGLAASVFGFWDWLAIPSETRAKRIGLLHGAGNMIVLLLFAISWLIRWYDLIHAPGTVAFLLGAAGLVLSGVTGWLGGELVDRLGVGVDPGAHLNSPSALSGLPASTGAPASPAPPAPPARETRGTQRGRQAA